MTTIMAMNNTCNTILSRGKDIRDYKYEDYDTELDLVGENYGVCISIPRTLLGDQKVLEMNELDKIIPTLRINTSEMAS